MTDWRGMVSQNCIAQHSSNLLAALASKRENTDTVRAKLYELTNMLMCAERTADHICLS